VTVENNLARWLELTLGVAGASVTLLDRNRATGFSSDTLVLDAAWQGGGGSFVVRVDPGAANSLYQEHDLDAQWRVIDALARLSDVPVPRIVGHQTDDPWVLGRPFFVMERVDGVAPADSPPFTKSGWVMDATDAERARLHGAGVDVLARIHAVDWQAAGLAFLQNSTANPACVAAAFEHDRGFFDWVVGGRPVPVFAHALAWMERNLPDDPADPVLSWGDARLGNMLVVGFEPVAVLDWEMVTLAAREADLAWWLVFDRLHTDGIRRPRPGGFLAESQVIERYQQHSGHTVRDLTFYLIRAAYRAGLLLWRFTDLLVQRGDLAPDAPRTPATPGITVLSALLSPDGGHRALSA